MHQYQEALREKMEYKTRTGPGGMDLNYIDARDVMDRLDEVVGIGNWQCDYKEIKGNVYCGIGIRTQMVDNLKSQKIPDGSIVKTGYTEWTWKWDCGSESNIEAEKGESSDAFKRAAVKWGIGRFLYDNKLPKKTTPSYSKPAEKPLEKISESEDINCKDCNTPMIEGKNGSLYCKPCYIKWKEKNPS